VTVATIKALKQVIFLLTERFWPK